MRLTIGKLAGIALVATASIALAVPQAMAQRNPAYAAARAAGQVGEMPDGYLGFASPPTPAVEALVRDINIKRKDAYTESARTSGSTVKKFAFITGCNLIATTKPGEKYQAPDGRWLTRDSTPPIRDAECPQ